MVNVFPLTLLFIFVLCILLMSAPVSKPTYASVVAGTAHSNPSTKGSVASRRKNTTAKPRSRQTIQPRIEVPYVAEATPLQSSGIQVTDDVKVEPVPSVLPSITETRAEGSVSADASSDREDADPNRLYDPEDSVYRGPSSVNRVQNDSPAAVSVIQTRAAKARASNVLSTPGTSGSTFLASRPAGCDFLSYIVHPEDVNLLFHFRACCIRSSTKGAIASEPDGSDVDGGSDGEHVSPNHASESEQDADSAEASSDSDGVDAQYYKDKDLDRYDSSSSFIDDTIIDVDADLDEAAKREVSKKR
ncbi:hypothetical protein EST38_g14660 [Candolleomyces aberdarensis]|uniref:Uncharacterized protein n=1 Tax=Candolleomyces aberdarensis TaxID=2316362 RepID=A0A4Q2CZD5_9AGAR|nr:hypothetical protein EST38_g14660 [Candolleomyces aberdarensis]